MPSLLTIVDESGGNFLVENRISVETCGESPKEAFRPYRRASFESAPGMIAGHLGVFLVRVAFGILPHFDLTYLLSWITLFGAYYHPAVAGRRASVEARPACELKGRRS